MKFNVGSEVTRLNYSADGKKLVAAASDLAIRTYSPVPPMPQAGRERCAAPFSILPP